ncbi:MAG: 6-carboxytetrahydropterin synthase QueD [Candidatus Peregrinibacteria bacterium]
MLVGKEFTFDSAHFLPQYYGKCERMHGHTYRLRVTVDGRMGENGLVIDFVVLKKIIKEQVLDKLDHQVLNDIIQIPSCENIAKWIWDKLVDLKSHIRRQLDDPNLPASITKYFKESGKDMDTSEFSTQVRLHEIALWENPTSFAIYKGE